MQLTKKRRNRWLRWLGFSSLALLLILTLCAAFLPRILETESVRKRILDQANAILSPHGSLKVARFQFSWFGPTRMTGFTLQNSQRGPLVRSETVVWNRTLFHILFARPDYGTLDLGPARLDIKRSADGTVDLAAALAPLQIPNPRVNLNVLIRNGKLHFTTPEMPPLDVADVDVTLNRPPAPALTSWKLHLTSATADQDLKITGSMDRWTTTRDQLPDLKLDLDGRQWPLEFSVPELRGAARYDGQIKLIRSRGEWSIAGDARLLSASATGPLLQNRQISIPELAGQWDLTQVGGLWSVARLDVQSPVGTLKAKPTRSFLEETRITADLDLAALLALNPSALAENLTIHRGHANLTINARPSPLTIASRARIVPVSFRQEAAVPPPPIPRPPIQEDPKIQAKKPVVTPPTPELPDSPPAPQLPDSPPATTPAVPAPLVDLPQRIAFDAQLTLPDLQLSSVDGGQLEVPPLSLAIRAAYDTSAPDRVLIESIELQGPQGHVEASGSLDELTARKLVNLQGQFTPDWDQVKDRLNKELKGQASLSGDPIAFHVKGPLAGELTTDALLDRLVLDTSWDMKSASVFGINVGPTTFAARAHEGKVDIAPFRATVNGGIVEASPTLVKEPDGTWTAGLQPGSYIKDAAINEDVSHRFLSYVVPLLDDATRVRGRLSAVIDSASFPLDSSSAQPRSAVVEGKILFQDVAFSAGPLARELTGLIAPGASPELRLEDSVLLDIHDNRVYQHGLAIGLGNVAQVTLDGSVGFDQSLDLAVAFPLRADRFQNVPVFNNIAPAIRPVIPVRGTLSEPRIDGDALSQAMGKMGLDIANEATFGGLDLIFKLIEPKTPEEAARRTAAAQARRLETERKRQERRDREAQKKLQRQLDRNEPR